MRLKKLFQKIITSILLCTILLAESQQVKSVYAESMKFYNHTRGITENYKGKQVSYTYNGRKLSLTYPGIIVDSIAMVDCSEVFEKELGLSVSINGEKITITDGISVMKLTLGSNKATFNEKTLTTSVVPVKLSFDNTVKYYVPSRFVAEAFGFNYVWNSSTNTVKITKILNLSINNKDVAYNGNFYTASYGDSNIASVLPMLYYNSAVYAPASIIFEAAGCICEENGSSWTITKGELSLKTDINSNIAFLNGKKYIMNGTPVQITDKTTGISMVYFPFEFVADMLGFEWNYNEEERCYALFETEHTGKATEVSEPVLTPAPQEEELSTIESLLATTDMQNRTYYFEWEGEEFTDKNPENNYLTKVSSYLLENNIEVLEFYGINSSIMECFMDNGNLIVELFPVINNLGDQFHGYDNSPHLFYTLFVSLFDNVKVFTSPHTDIQWHIVETPESVQIYFYDAALVSTDNMQEEVPESVYPDDKMIIPIPETSDGSQICDKDNYLEKNFQISIPGNHEEFYQENLIRNPYYMIKEYTVVYNPTTDTTDIVFDTRAVCGYTYTLQDGYLEVSIGRPNEIFSKIVVLDAGHGGIDPGAIRNGYNEKDINFTILNNYTKQLFSNSDIKVYFTRETDVLIDLYDRAAFASEIGADLFLSLHMNSNNSSTVNGTEIFYSSYNNTVTENGLNSARLGKTLAENISSFMGTKNRGVTNSEYVVVKYNTVPAVLIELGFMTNKSDLSKITNKEYQKKAAEAIYMSVFEIFELFPTGR